jgi:NADP-dependent 3-hydroxy acid dehydrogenase YdfG
VKIMSDNIAGKVVVISGLGEVLARLLSVEGARVVLGARRQDRIQALEILLGPRLRKFGNVA